ncbi:unnamed protein product, partial [Iphiclides podalirius]
MKTKTSRDKDTGRTETPHRRATYNGLHSSWPRGGTGLSGCIVSLFANFLRSSRRNFARALRSTHPQPATTTGPLT